MEPAQAWPAPCRGRARVRSRTASRVPGTEARAIRLHLCRMEIEERLGVSRRPPALVRRPPWVQNGRILGPAEWNRSVAWLRLRQPTATDSGLSHRPLETRRRREARRAFLKSAGAAVPTGTGPRQARWNRGATLRAATAADHRPDHSWICGSRSCGRPPTGHRAADMAATMLRRIMPRHIMPRVTADRIVRRATAAAAATRVRRAADIPPAAGITRLRSRATDSAGRGVASNVSTGIAG